MFDLRKTIDTMSVRIVINNQRSFRRVRGDVYLFPGHVEAVTFNLSTSDSTPSIIESSLELSRINGCSLGLAARVREAMAIAHHQADYYLGLIESLKDSDNYNVSLNNLFDYGDDDRILDALMLTPGTTSSGAIENVLAKLNTGKYLGLNGTLKASVVDGFFDLDGKVLEAVITLCKLHPKYELHEDGHAGSMNELFNYLESVEVLSSKN